MFGTIPSKMGPFILFLGLTGAYFLTSIKSDETNNFKKSEDLMNTEMRLLDETEVKYTMLKSNFLNEARFVKDQLGVKDSIYGYIGSDIYLVQHSFSKEEPLYANLVKEYKNLNNVKIDLNVIKSRYIISLENHKEILDDFEDFNKSIFIPFAIVIMVLVALGVNIIFNELISEKSEKKFSKRQSDKIYSECQSCGFEFSSLRLNGTNKDKSTNLGFCALCFENGRFTNPELTQIIALANYRKVYSKGYFLVGISDRKFQNLERWSKYHKID